VQPEAVSNPSDQSLTRTPSSPIAQNPGKNSGTSPSDRFLQLRTNWQQRPETPALISRIHTSASHHIPDQCSDSAEESIRPRANHPPRRHELTASITPTSLLLRVTETVPAPYVSWQKSSALSTMLLTQSLTHQPSPHSSRISRHK